MSETSDTANLKELLEALGPYAEGTIIATGQIVTAIINAVGRLAEGIASGGVDAALSLAMIAAGLGTYIYFLNTKPYSTILKFLKLDGLYDVLALAFKSLTAGPESQIKTVSDNVNKQAQDCIVEQTQAGVAVDPQLLLLRDASAVVSATQSFTSSFLGQIVTLGVPVNFITDALGNAITGTQGTTLNDVSAQSVALIKARCEQTIANAKAGGSGTNPNPGHQGF